MVTKDNNSRIKIPTAELDAILEQCNTDKYFENLH